MTNPICDVDGCTKPSIALVYGHGDRCKGCMMQDLRGNIDG